MLFFKMVIVPLMLLLLGATAALYSPGLVLLIAGCGVLASLIYCFHPSSSDYGYRPYLLICGLLAAKSGSLMLIGYSGIV